MIDQHLTSAAKQRVSYQGFLAELLLAEVDDRDGVPLFAESKVQGSRGINGWRASTSTPTLISKQPLSSSSLIGLGTAAAEQGFRVRYTLATKFVNELVEAADERQLAKTANPYGRVDPLIIDELGYMELDGAALNSSSPHRTRGEEQCGDRV